MNIYEPTDEQKAEWMQWLADLSECALPGPDEITGSLDWSIDDIRDFMGE